MNAVASFLEQLQNNRAGQGGVAVSVCSAHPFVLRAALRMAKRYKTFALIESTSNQVDQYGGYTGMQPIDFVALVRTIADEEGFSFERILLGGDHLGPNTWRAEGAAAAMHKACALVSAYVEAGYRKIHLDASFVCADDQAPLTDAIVAERCARMAAAAELAAKDQLLPIYVIGTEVPTPGGVQKEEGMHITTPSDVERTLAVFKETFLAHGLDDAWTRVVGLVIQPGVEFGDAMVHDFSPSPALAATILQYPSMIFEAHSTDYQAAQNLARMVDNRFFILKVGPWLTFALREALFQLELIEQEIKVSNPSNFRATLMQVMQADPAHWQAYYTGSSAEIDFKLAFSYSDRARYYLTHPAVQKSLAQLLDNLAAGVPEALISQYLPQQYNAERAGFISNHPLDLAIDRVSSVLEHYHLAGLKPTL